MKKHLKGPRGTLIPPVPELTGCVLRKSSALASSHCWGNSRPCFLVLDTVAVAFQGSQYFYLVKLKVWLLASLELISGDKNELETLLSM